MELPNRPTKDPYQELPIKDYSYINTEGSGSKKKNKKPIIWIVFGLIILVLLGVGAFSYGHFTKDKPAKHSTSSTTKKSTTTTTKSKATSGSVNVPLTSYSSTIFNVSFKYPTAWTVVANGNTSLTVTSPLSNLVADTGKTVSGKEVFSITPQGQIPAGFGSGSVAVLNSQLVSYSSPTSSQAAQTYVSFVQYPATNILGGLDGIYITGNNGYLKDEAVTTAQVNQVSPLIITSFVTCQSQACTSTTPLTISSTMWSNSSFSTPILDIVKSLSFN